MFTGIITHIGAISAAQKQDSLRITIACDFAGELRIGESVACNGACLTVVDRTADNFSADLSEETLRCTAPHWSTGSRINLERSLKLGDALDGHLVTGHIDGVATIDSIEDLGNSYILAITAPNELSRFIATKGSVTLDGVSLTVNKVEGTRFWVNIIPHTLAITTLGTRKKGDSLNLEIDLMARYAARLLQA